MLQFIRNRAQSWIAWIIVGFISMTFAVWGVQNYITGAVDIPVAEVDGVEISQSQLQRAFLQQRQRMQEMFGDNFRPEFFPEERMRREIVQEMIKRELLIGAAHSAGFQIGDNQVAAAIRIMPELQEEGAFTREAYERALRLAGMTPGMFEQLLRRDLVVRQYSEGITKSSFATEWESNLAAKLEAQQRKIGYMVVSPQGFADKVDVNESEIDTHYQENPSLYTVPEKVSVEYLELKADEIAEDTEVSDETLRSRYEAQKDNYHTPEERSARHILLNLEEGADEETEKAARDKMATIFERLEQGDEFEALAKEFSDDSGSAANGGSLGFFSRGAMVKPFEEAAFALEKGGMSEVVRSQFGLHLIKLDDIRGGAIKSFDEVREELRKEVQREEADKIFYDQADILGNQSYEHPDTLMPAAEALGIEVAVSTLFSRSGGGESITNVEKIRQAAFSEDVLQRGNNSEVIEIEPTHLVVLRIKEHQPESVRPLDDVRDEIRTTLKNRKEADAAREAADALKQRLEDGEEPPVLAQEQELDWKSEDALTRSADEPNISVVRAVFRMPRPQEEKPYFERVEVGREQYLVGLYAVSEGEVDDPGEKSDAISSAYGEADSQGVIEALRASADIMVRANLDPPQYNSVRE